MRFEYILLLILSILPLLYKVCFWGVIFERSEYSVKQFMQSLRNKEQRRAYHHFWNVIELPLLLFSLSVFYFAPFEILVYNFCFYMLILYNIFVLGKIFRKRLEYFHNFPLFLFVILSVWATIIGVFLWWERSIYIWILFPLVCMPVYYIVWLWIYHLCKNIWKK